MYQMPFVSDTWKMPAKTDKSASFTKEDFYVSVDNLVSISVISGLFYLLPAAAFFPDFLPSPTYTREWKKL